MPRTLSSLGIIEKNKLVSSTVWLLMLEITIPGGGVIRVTSNNESVTWREETWIAFPFELEDINEDSKGEVPQVTLRMSNINRVMESYIQAYDIYCKVNGFSPIPVIIYVVNNYGSFSSGVVTDSTADGAVTDTSIEGATTNELYDIANPDPEATFEFELVSPKTDSMYATFTLGASNPYNKRFPMHRMMKNHCRHRFKDVMCKYAGATTTCDKTLPACRAMNGGSNSVNFGGFPGIGLGGLRLAT